MRRVRLDRSGRRAQEQKAPGQTDVAGNSNEPPVARYGGCSLLSTRKEQDESVRAKG